MADTEVKEILSSFAAGCLDKENYVQFKKHLEAGGDLPKGELGELQNLISLIPIILETEKPAPILKNKLAKNLVRIQKEKTQTKSELKQTKATKDLTASKHEDKPKKTKVKETKAKPPAEEKPELRPHDETSVKEITLTPIRERIERSTAELPMLPKDDEVVVKKSPLFVKMLLVFLALLAAASITLNILWKTDYENDVAQLRADLASLNAEVQVSGKFVSDYRVLIEFLDQQNISVVNLRGTDYSPQTTGKIFFALTKNQLLIEIKNPKQLQMNETLQLWVGSGSSTKSVGTFNYNPAYKYLEITNIPDLNKSDLSSVVITVEPRIGADSPTGPIYLSGSF